jgi:tetratricopeptide (TPR) repeat protein
MERSKELMEQGNFGDAIELLLKLMTDMPESMYVKNNLALAYYCNHDYPSATIQTKEVLLREPNNVQAHCNMAVFMKGAKDKQGMERECEYLKNLRSTDPDDLNRAALTLIELERIADAYALQQRLVNLMPYDKGIIHRTALCAYRLGEYRQAAGFYERLMKIDEYDSVCRYYGKLCRESELTGKRYDFSLNYQVPVEETLERIQRLNRFIGMPDDNLGALWREDKGELEMLVHWGLNLEEHSVKKAMLGLSAGFGDAKAERLIRDFLLSRTQPAELKRDAFGLLKHMGAEEPYIAYIDGELVESKIDMIRLLEGDVPKAYRDVIAICIAGMHDDRDEACLISAAEIWGEYVGRLDGFPRLSAPQKNALAAVLEYLACAKCGYEVTKPDLCKKHGVTLTRFDHALEKLTRKKREKP